METLVQDSSSEEIDALPSIPSVFREPAGASIVEATDGFDDLGGLHAFSGVTMSFSIEARDRYLPPNQNFCNLEADPRQSKHSLFISIALSHALLTDRDAHLS